MIFAVVRPNTVSTNCLQWMNTSVRCLQEETDRRDVRDHFVKLQLMEDRGLSSCVNPNHQDRHLGLADQRSRGHVVVVSANT